MERKVWMMDCRWRGSVTFSRSLTSKISSSVGKPIRFAAASVDFMQVSGSKMAFGRMFTESFAPEAGRPSRLASSMAAMRQALSKA